MKMRARAAVGYLIEQNAEEVKGVGGSSLRMRIDRFARQAIFKGGTRLGPGHVENTISRARGDIPSFALILLERGLERQAL
jgi:hypothetical protein